MIGQPQTQDAFQSAIHLADPSEQPRDSVSSIAWAPSGNNPTFATSDWDSQIRIYRIESDPQTLAQETQFDAESPCLSVKWDDDESRLFAGCADGTVKLFDIEGRGNSQEVGKHEGPVKSLHWIASQKFLATVSFDKTMKIWDPRQNGHTMEYKLEHKPFCSDFLYPYFAVGLSDAKILILDLDEFGNQVKYQESPLGRQSNLMNIKLSLSRAGEFAIGMSGNDGRSNISKLGFRNDSTRNLQSFITFKVPEKARNESTTRYPVNCFGFHPHRGHQFVYTGEGDGRMFFWDSVKKWRIADFDFKGNAITQAEIDPTGKYMAYSLGYDWARGIQGYMSQPSKVCVHAFQEKELEYNAREEVNYPYKYSV